MQIVQNLAKSEASLLELVMDCTLSARAMAFFMSLRAARLSLDLRDSEALRDWRLADLRRRLSLSTILSVSWLNLAISLSIAAAFFWSIVVLLLSDLATDLAFA